jgi:diacylglycerol kinase family enzyme
MKTMTKKLGGKAAYFLATVQGIRAQKPPTISINADGLEVTLEDCSLVTLANGKFFGGGMMIAPLAELDDGKLDLITIQNLRAWFFWQHGYRVYQGTHLELPNVQAHQKSDILVQAKTKDPVYVEVDGELFAELPARFTVLRDALLMVR